MVPPDPLRISFRTSWRYTFLSNYTCTASHIFILSLKLFLPDSPPSTFYLSPPPICIPLVFLAIHLVLLEQPERLVKFYTVCSPKPTHLPEPVGPNFKRNSALSFPPFLQPINVSHFLEQPIILSI